MKRQGIHMFGDDQVDITKLTGQVLDFYWHYRGKIVCAVENVKSRHRQVTPLAYLETGIGTRTQSNIFSQGMRVLIQGLNGQPLKRLEIKIIHQLLQQDFPFLVAMITPTRGHMIVVWANPGQVR